MNNTNNFPCPKVSLPILWRIVLLLRNDQNSFNQTESLVSQSNGDLLCRGSTTKYVGHSITKSPQSIIYVCVGDNKEHNGDVQPEGCTEILKSRRTLNTQQYPSSHEIR